MKRSEMIQILLGSVYDNIRTYGGDGLDTSDIEKVLADMEKAGMLPPMTFGYCGDDYDRETQEPTPRYGHINKWDDE